MRLTADKVVTWTDATAPAGVTPEKVYLGPDPFGLGGFQVAVAAAGAAPPRQALRDLFTARKGKTQTQLVVAVVHDGRVHMFGPDPQAQPIELPQDQAERQPTWLKQDRIDRGEIPGVSTTESAELRSARRRIRELETELVILR